MARLQEGKSLGAPPTSPSIGETVGSKELYDALDREFPYMALDTCATDGLCATACPVSIDTGQLVKRFRNLRATPARRNKPSASPTISPLRKARSAGDCAWGMPRKK